MNSDSLRLNSLNPQHWLILMRWMRNEPDGLRAYIRQQGELGQSEMKRALIFMLGITAFLPLVPLSILFGLQMWYIPPLAVVSVGFCAIAFGLIYDTITPVWVTSSATLLIITMHFILFILRDLGPWSGMIEANFYSVLYFLGTIVVAPVVIYKDLQLVSTMIRLADIVWDSKSSVPHFPKMWMLPSALILMVVYGCVLYWQFEPIDDNFFLKAIAVGFYPFVSPFFSDIVLGGVAWMVCTTFSTQVSLRMMTYRIVRGIVVVMIGAGTVEMTSLFRSEGLLKAFITSVYWITLTTLLLLVLIIAYGFIYAYIYRFVISMLGVEIDGVSEHKEKSLLA